jgi:hypothetical protein
MFRVEGEVERLNSGADSKKAGSSSGALNRKIIPDLPTGHVFDFKGGYGEQFGSSIAKHIAPLGK